MQMIKKSLNRLLAENLSREMLARGISANELGRMVGVSPRTIGNYLALDPAITPHTGKERSAKLFEVEAVARKLGIPALSLLTDHNAGPAPLSDAAMQVAAHYDALDAAQRTALDALVQAMQRPGPKRAG